MNYPKNRKSRHKLDLTNQKFGKLTVIEELQQLATRSHRFYKCVCECTRMAIVSMNHLRTGHTKSCGCYAEEVKPTIRFTHGYARNEKVKSEYRIWQNMKSRCYNNKVITYPDYGGRGISVCARWLESFENFLADMGPKPKDLTLDRIDANGNYEPANCRWANWHTQRINRRTI